MRPHRGKMAHSRQPLTAAAVLTFAMAAALLLLLALHGLVAEKIQREEQRYRTEAMRALLTTTAHNTPLPPPLPLSRQLAHSRLIALYPIYAGKRQTALLIQAVAEDGYNGAIELLFAYYRQQPAATTQTPPLRVLRHRETAGITDFLTRQQAERAYDGVSGATISATAIRRAAASVGDWVRACLRWSEAQRQQPAADYLIQGC